MSNWLIEEHTGPGLDQDKVTYHTIVRGKPDVKDAFLIAEKRAIGERVKRHHARAEEPFGFLFTPDELLEIDEGYRWMASDGSYIWYEVRRLDNPA
jgi:hypothetical protein